MSDDHVCPQCGSELPPETPEGLCPKCLLQAALPAETPPSAFVPPTVEQLAPLFPQLEILEPLGHGGMGAVYKARQTKLDRLVALKIIRPESADDAAFAERFTREARTLARLSHGGIVGVHDFGESGDDVPLYYFVMEYVDGVNLRQLLEDGQLAPEQALAIVPQICEALQYAHEAGVVHRDVKPENILLDSTGRVKIADFGLARLVEHSAENFTLTDTHQIMGTPRYMAPEQMEGSHAVDHRADIYSLGVVFYEMLTGQVPAGHFDPPSRKVEIDVRLDEVVLRSLAREPDRRYQQASKMKSDVDDVVSSYGHPTVTADPVAVSPPGRRAGSKPRFSRMAIAGAVMFSGVLIAPALVGIQLVASGNRLLEDYYPAMAVGGGIAILSGIASTICGLIAVITIRNSGGTISGAVFAVSVLIAFPLLVINGIILGLSLYFFNSGLGMNFAMSLWLAVMQSALIGGWLSSDITKRVWAAATSGTHRTPADTGESPTPRAERATGRSLLQYALLLGILLGGSWLIYLGYRDYLLPSIAEDLDVPVVEPQRVVAPEPDWQGEVKVASVPSRDGLHATAAAGLHERVKEFIARGVDRNTRDAAGQTPLMKAADAGEWRIAGLLLAFGALPDLQDDTGRTALMHAIENSFFEERQKGKTAETLLRLGRADPSQRGDVELIKADALEVFDALKPETRGQGRVVLNPVSFDLDLQDEDGETALVKAVEQGDMKLVRLLIEDGADAGLKDRHGRTAHDIAQQEGHDAIASYLAKARPELHAAAQAGDVARIRELLASDVPVDGNDVNGRTPLMLASANGHLRAMLLLIMNGANEREKDTRHRTPLMHSAEAGQTRAIELLSDLPRLSVRNEVQARFRRLDRELFADVDFAALEFDVGFNLQDEVGETALMKAAKGGHVEAVNLLLRDEDGRRRETTTLQDKLDRTALTHAVLAGQREFLQAMMENRDGAISTEVSVRLPMPEFMEVDVLLLEDSDGRNGLEVLEAHGFDDIAKQLREIVQLALDKLTANIAAGESQYPSGLYRWRSELWQLLRETVKADADRAESQQLMKQPDNAEVDAEVEKADA